jgi:hypothetical protein
MSNLRGKMLPVRFAYARLAIQMDCTLWEDGAAFLPLNLELSLH